MRVLLKKHFIPVALAVGSLCFSLIGCERGLSTPLQSSTGTQTSPPPAPASSAAPVPTLTFSIFPNTVAEGDSATLQWTATNATTVTINNGIGVVPTTGSTSIKATSTETFVAMASGSGGTTEQQATLNVEPRPKLSVSVCPAIQPSCDGGASTLIQTSESAVISWQAQNATAVTIEQVSGQRFAVDGSFTTPPVSESATYTLVAAGPGGNTSVDVTVDVTSRIPHHKYVALVVEENHSYSQVIGNPVMPFLNHLAQRGALATEYFANTHGSLRDYFELTAGKFLVSGGDFNGSVTADQIVAHLIKAGKTWKSYAQSLPWIGYTGYNVYPYEKDHNPLAYFTDIANNPAQAANLVPFNQLIADINQGTLPNLIYIAPDAQHDAHDCPTGTRCSDSEKLAAADQWLQANLTALLDDDDFANNGMLLITFDESIDSDSEDGGGHVILIAVGAGVRSGYHSPQFYQHQSTLRTMCEALDIHSCPGDGAQTNSMLDMFVP